MPKSKVNPQYEYSLQEWVISVINTGSKLGGHAALVVEGMEVDPLHPFHERPFIGQYDIAAHAEENQDNIINTKGIITKIHVYENEENTRDYELKKYPAYSYMVTPWNAHKMITSIKHDKERTEFGMKNLLNPNERDALHLDENGQIIHPMRFQYLGKTHPLIKFFGDTEAGNNCAGWCLEKLTENAGITDDKILPKPKKVAGQCIIL